MTIPYRNVLERVGIVVAVVALYTIAYYVGHLIAAGEPRYSQLSGVGRLVLDFFLLPFCGAIVTVVGVLLGAVLPLYGLLSLGLWLFNGFEEDLKVINEQVKKSERSVAQDGALSSPDDEAGKLSL